MLQTTTNISRYTSDALAQDNSSEGGSYSSFSPCPLCHCMFNPDGDCCCDGVPAIGYYYYCSCGICGHAVATYILKESSHYHIKF